MLTREQVLKKRAEVDTMIDWYSKGFAPPGKVIDLRVTPVDLWRIADQKTRVRPYPEKVDYKKFTLKATL